MMKTLRFTCRADASHSKALPNGIFLLRFQIQFRGRREEYATKALDFCLVLR